VSRLLIVDDDRSIRRTLQKLFTDGGYEVATAADGREALEALRLGGADAVLLDLGLPEMDGIEVLGEARALPSLPPIIVITAREDMDSTVRAIQLGAYDYLVKPLDIDRLKLLVSRAVQSRETSRTLHHLVSEASAAFQVGNIIGRSTAMREIYKTIGAVSTSRASVLIQGESGTGKELVAKAIHYASEDREKPFMAVNCTAFARDLLESELFGHVRGAFTGAVVDKAGRFELAGSGTLFLDEVAEIPLELQAKLLRVLQERTFERVGDARPIALRARIVAATHRDLDDMVRRGEFREDLLYRLRVVEIRLPPLRERPEDIPLLVDTLLGRINRELHKRVRYVSQEALDAIAEYPWPGNVRELENALTRAVVLSKDDVLDARLLPIGRAARPDGGGAGAGAEAPGTSDGEGEAVLAGGTAAVGGASAAVLPLREVERRHIAEVLGHTGWNKRRASALLDISRPTLDRKIEEFGLKRPED
jgi:DNA-binding NtrC family response regulator